MTATGEDLLKQKFRRLIDMDFQVYAEVRGRHLVHSSTVVIDFLLFPTQCLTENGFDKVWFGVEVKHFGKPGETGKMSRFICQCASYVQSEFTVGKKAVRPAFVLGFSDVYSANREGEEYLMQWLGMLRLAALLKVGMFSEISPSSFYPDGGWKIEFSSSLYFKATRGRYERKEYNISKVNVGNCT